MALCITCLTEEDVSTLTATRLKQEMQSFPDGLIVPCRGGLASFSGRKEALGLRNPLGLLMFMGNTFLKFTLEDRTLVLVDAPENAEDEKRHVVFIPVGRGETAPGKLMRVWEKVLHGLANQE